MYFINACFGNFLNFNNPSSHYITLNIFSCFLFIFSYCLSASLFTGYLLLFKFYWLLVSLLLFLLFMKKLLFWYTIESLLLSIYVMNFILLSFNISTFYPCNLFLYFILYTFYSKRDFLSSFFLIIFYKILFSFSFYFYTSTDRVYLILKIEKSLTVCD